jgi:lipopolysaccharide export system protein LptC
MPVLIEHYQEHKQKVSDITFWEFLVMHYKTDASHDNQDNELPFKDKNHSYTAPAVSLPFQRLVLKEPITSTEIEHTSSYKVAHFTSPNQAIFQPPKL